MIRITGLSLTLLVCSACSSVPMTVATSESAYKAGPDGLADVACLYQTHASNTESGQQDKLADKQWYLWRQGSSVEVKGQSSPIGEHWQRLKHNEVALTWLYHDHHFAVRYSPSALKLTGNQTDWTTKASIISPALLKQLKKVGDSTVLGFAAERYQGHIGQYDLDITWIPALSIPALIVQQEDTGNRQQVSRVELIQVYPYQSAPWHPPSHDTYDDIDFADLGDNEANPMVRLFMHGIEQQQKTEGRTIQYPHQH